MPRRNITGLPVPDPDYTPELRIRRPDGRIETEDAAKSEAEDATRTRFLRFTAERATKRENRRAALRLAHKLDYAARGEEPPESCASSGYMRQQCINVAGNFWKLHDEVTNGASAAIPPMFRTVSIMRSDWEMPISQLLATNPTTFLERLRVDLYDCGAADTQGALIVGLHGEYAPHDALMRTHGHAIAIGDMAEVINRLRDLPGYAPIVRKYGDKSRCTPTIRMSIKPLVNLPDPFTYIAQRFWPSRWEGFINGVFRRQRKARIKGNTHSKLLLWLDQWPLQDLTLMMGMRATKNGFVLTDAHTPMGALNGR